MDEQTRKKKYRGELLTAGMVLGLAMFVVLVLQYLARDLPGGFLSGLLSFAGFAVIVAVLIVYGRRAAALCPPDPVLRPGGFTYGRAFGFSILVSLLSGIVYGAGYFLMTEVVDPRYFAQGMERVAELYVSSGLMTAEQVREGMALMHNLFVVIFANMIAMSLQGGFLALFTSAIVRHRTVK
ncbi:DUF4199 domain-containing protein [uncultured Rikenella sp.]|uniref:DUF4199 domain-containing protein n=1 Tax=uncultured Rikenella sp. TaxID=368003 RepID=UPI0026131D1A|nr:DUF4199 domain-containing protein [uncultured Rikenella sp.]